MIQFLKFIKNTVLLFVLILISCGSGQEPKARKPLSVKSITQDSLNILKEEQKIIVGANQSEKYLSLLKGKNVGVVANQTSVIFKQVVSSQISQNDKHIHLVDSLLALNISVKKVFAPEHGFRGTADAGELVKDGIDNKTGLPIISLYGKNKKPFPEQLENLDIVVFDIQDVGVRFYTYISTLHYIMEACAENNIPVLILDRPNPNSHFIDGPILELEHKSFVGMHPVPVVHGMTIGEYAQMINGEGWLNNGITCDITVIPIDNYNHNKKYSLPIKPSPNLPNDKAINLYPSLCFFEGTYVSVGRGTDKQFQIIGTPYKSLHSFAFTPQPNEGAKHPKHDGKLCKGINLENIKYLNEINLEWLIQFYEISKQTPDKPFFNTFFTKLAGTEKLQKQIELGFTAKEIKTTWKDDINKFKLIRSKYLIYN
ncbi:MAG: DUF1343 domain-containing protein [Flavobacteriaceae bacterium]|nr:DUF1343 domain-containing protein [Flavobacteriaceae bacterium]